MPADTAQLGADLAHSLMAHLPPQAVAPAVQAALRAAADPHNAGLSPADLGAVAAKAVASVLPPPYNMAITVAVEVGMRVLAWAESRPVSAPGMRVDDRR